jgi:hypothetical protein
MRLMIDKFACCRTEGGFLIKKKCAPKNQAFNLMQSNIAKMMDLN